MTAFSALGRSIIPCESVSLNPPSEAVRPQPEQEAVEVQTSTREEHHHHQRLKEKEELAVVMDQWTERGTERKGRKDVIGIKFDFKEARKEGGMPLLSWNQVGQSEMRSKSPRKGNFESD